MGSGVAADSCWGETPVPGLRFCSPSPQLLSRQGKEALLRLVWVAGHSDLTQVVMGNPDLTTNGEVGRWVNLPATR